MAIRLLLCLAWCVGGLLPGTVQATPTVIIDPGHGGAHDAGSDAARDKSTSNNATSVVHHFLEKDFTLQLARLVTARVNAGGRVRAVLTRDADVNLDFARRAAVAADNNAVAWVSIHFNSDESHRASGPRAIIGRQANNPNFDADKAFGLALAGAVEGVSKRYRPETPVATWHDDRELHGRWGSYLFYQLRRNPPTRHIPACHLEVEFLDNPGLEETFFVERRDEVFAAWADAIAHELERAALR